MGLEGVGEPLLTAGTSNLTGSSKPPAINHYISADNRLTPLRAHGIPCMSMGFLLPNSPSGSNNADTPVVWRGMMVMKAVQQLLFDVDWKAGGNAEDLDALIVDTPPGTGDVALSLGQLVNVDGALRCFPAVSAVSQSSSRPQGPSLSRPRRTLRSSTLAKESRCFASSRSRCVPPPLATLRLLTHVVSSTAHRWSLEHVTLHLPWVNHSAPHFRPA